MNTKVVRSFGLALIVAVGVLALLLVTGTFSPQKAGADIDSPIGTTHGVTTSPESPGPGAAVGLTLTFGFDGALARFDEVTITLSDFDIPSDLAERAISIRSAGEGGPPSTVEVNGDEITLELDNIDEDGLGLDATTDVELVIKKSGGITAPASAGTYKIEIAHGDAAAVELGTVTIARTLSVDPAKGGSGAEVTVTGKAFADGTGTLFSEPLIEPDFNEDGAVDQIVFDITVGTVGDADDENDLPTNSSTGDYTLDVDGDGVGDYELRTYTIPAVGAQAAINVYVAVLPGYDDTIIDSNVDADAVELGYRITLAPVPDDADTDPAENTPTIDTPTDPDRTSLKSGVMANDGAFETTVDAKDLEKAMGDGRSVITFRDSNGDEATTVFTVTGTTTLGSDSVGKGKTLKISISDWVADEPIDVKIDGESLTIMDEDGEEYTVELDDNAATFYVKVTEKVGLGTKTVVLFGPDTEDDADTDPDRLDSASVEITAVDLTVSPSTAVVGREVTVTGSGFAKDVVKIEVGGVAHCDNLADCNIAVASGGRVVAAFRIPNHEDLADADDYTVTVTDNEGRIGTGTVSIPERTLTVDPPESRIGSTINLSGTGWPTGTGANLVSLWYEGADGDLVQYASAITGNDGTWSESIEVPSDADVGMTHDVEARATVGDDKDNVRMDATHKTPDAVVTLSSAQAQRGSYVTVSGENFHTFQTVTIEIVESDVTPSGLTTDVDGSFSGQVLVPGLSLGNKNLKVTVNDVPVVEFLEIVDAPATPVVTSNDPADVFASLIEAGALDAVWVYNNDDGKYRGFIPGATDSEMMLAETLGIALTEVNSGDIAWINLNADATFQGTEYTAGWKLVTIN